jgi:glycine/D-amino acid oxidase-like deaminating enzyme
MERHYDVAIAGGGVMGASAAFWLTRMHPGLKVAVAERDPSYAKSATALSVASIRMQFSNEINVKISQFGIDFLRNIGCELGPAGEVSDLGFHERGYLFLAGTEAQAQAMRRVAALQRGLGAGTELLDPAELSARFPWLDLSGVALGSFGPRDEGWFDNMGLLWGFRRASKAQGAEFLAAEVSEIAREGGNATGLRLASGEILRADYVVIAAGTGAAPLLRAIGEELPVEPRKRTVFVIDAPNALAPGAPLLIDHTGFYLRPEGRNWIAATVPDEDWPCVPDDFEPAHTEFEEKVWPRLYARAPGFDAVKVIRAWAGHYDYNRLDQNAIVGRWPGIGGLYIMNGFSGHGLQQSPAMGRGIAELILSGGYQSLNLEPLGAERIFAKAPFLETAIV